MQINPRSQSTSLGTVVYLFLLLVLGSCGKSKKEETPVADSTKSLVQEDTISLPPDPKLAMLGLGQPEFGDLDSMIRRRRIRALVPYSRIFYFIDGKERRGLAYESLNLYEQALNRQLKFYPPKVRLIIIPVSRDQMLPLLDKGYADLALGALTITPDRKKIIDFSTPTSTGLKEIVVGGPGSRKLSSLHDLSGQMVCVQKGSSFQESLENLNDTLKRLGVAPVEIKPAPAYLDSEDLLEMVNAGLIPFTVATQNAAGLWSGLFDSLTMYNTMALRQNGETAWAFRKNSRALKASVDEFVNKNKIGTAMGNILYNRYFKGTKYLRNAQSSAALKQLKATETIFRKYGKEYDIDWLLLVAQGYQESQLNQNVKSSAGAIGIMQIIPTTASSHIINIPDITNADNNVHAGAKYLRWLVDNFFNDDTIDPFNKRLFALAAYNAGPTRVANLRKKALANGLDHNVWFNNVELVAAHEVGRETVQYVSNIYKYYSSYIYLRNYSEQSGKKLMP